MKGLFSAIVPDSSVAEVRRVLVTHMEDEDDQENEQEDEREDVKQRVEGRVVESQATHNMQMTHEMKFADKFANLSQCQCDIKSVVNQRENVTCEVCCSHFTNTFV